MLQYKLLLQIIDQQPTAGAMIQWAELNLPGRSVKSLQVMLGKIRKEVADADGAEPSEKAADEAANTAKAAGSTGKLLLFFLFILLFLFELLVLRLVLSLHKFLYYYIIQSGNYITLI